MCGISVVVCRNKERALQVNTLLRQEIAKRGPDWQDSIVVEINGFFVCISASVLWIRGSEIKKQPVCEDGDVFAWNGEMYNMPQGTEGMSDTAVIMDMLRKAEDPARVFCDVEGPFAFLFWSACLSSLFFGRNVFGQRSLVLGLFHPLPGSHPTNEPDHSIGGGHVEDLSNKEENGLLVLTSVVPLSLRNFFPLMQWSEVPASGIFTLNLSRDCSPPQLKLACRHHDPIAPKRQSKINIHNMDTARHDVSQTVLRLLDDAVRKRCHFRTSDFSRGGHRFRLLFSGGVDSTLLACLMHRHVDADCEIALRNVAFGARHEEAFDRRQCRVALSELKRLFPERRWRLEEVTVIDGISEEALDAVSQITFPQTTVMDITIGCVLWHAFAPYATEKKQETKEEDDDANDDAVAVVEKICITGIGADELFAGYTRHAARFRRGDDGCWDALEAEMKTDLARIAYRNNGRDDRMCGNHALEARHPFLDLDLWRFATECPVEVLVKWTSPSSSKKQQKQKDDKKEEEEECEGGKWVLRSILRDHYGMCRNVWNAPKKAMQFGSRMNHSFKEYFGGRKTSGKVQLLDFANNAE